MPDQIPNRLGVIHKNVSDWFYKQGVAPPPYTKTQSKTQKPNFRGQAIQEPIFHVSDAGFEGGDDGRGSFD